MGDRGQEREVVDRALEDAEAALHRERQRNLQPRSDRIIDAEMAHCVRARATLDVAHAACCHAGPDGAICELLSGHDRAHLRRLERGYVEWER